MDKKNKIYLRDGDILPPELQDKFEDADIRMTRKFGQSQKVIDFVGFIIEDEYDIFVFPKKFKLPDDGHVNLLFDLIIDRVQKNTSQELLRNENINTTFPFNSFFDIYEYYQSYGIYKEEDLIYIDGYYGEISWKKTINPQNMIFTSNGIILHPFKIKRKFSKDSLIGRAMESAINYTSRLFSSFINIEPIRDRRVEFAFFENKTRLIQELRFLENQTFKDVHKKLIRNLIDFYSEVNSGGIYYLKHYDFEYVWEELVQNYLINHFQGIENRKPVFSETPNPKFKFEAQKRFVVNKAETFKEIILDHYAIIDEKQYIFDSKYYNSLDSLDYKQMSYGFILHEYSWITEDSEGNILKKKRSNKIYNYMFLPGDNSVKTHFNLEDDFFVSEEPFEVLAVYLDVELLMKLYLK